jgi:hypothetical protein
MPRRSQISGIKKASNVSPQGDAALEAASHGFEAVAALDVRGGR